MNQLKKHALALSLVALMLAGCASVDVTKTAKGFFTPTDPNSVEILKTRPMQAFDELGTVTVTGFDPDESAKMHNAVRTKSAALGADAVILTEEGILKDGWSLKRWATGVAIRYKVQAAGNVSSPR